MEILLETILIWFSGNTRNGCLCFLRKIQINLVFFIPADRFCSDVDSSTSDISRHIMIFLLISSSNFTMLLLLVFFVLEADSSALIYNIPLTVLLHISHASLFWSVRSLDFHVPQLHFWSKISYWQLLLFFCFVLIFPELYILW